MASLMELQSQMEKLQKQVNEVKAKEYASTVQDILAKMKAFDISIKDLQSAKPARSAKTGKGKPSERKSVKTGDASKKPVKPVAAKYKGPNGETWSGRGLTPKWLAALVAQGQSKESFAISS